jgi:hypothetical protein
MPTMLLYHQAQIYARQGIALDRSTPEDWVGHAAWHLRPLHERLMRLKQLPKLFAVETIAPVVDPGRGRAKVGRFGPMPPMTVPGRVGSTRRCLCPRARSKSRAADRPP